MRLADAIKYMLTMNQYTFILLASSNRIGELSAYKNAAKCPILSETEKADLIMRGLALQTENGFTLTEVGRHILKDMDVADMAMEVFNLYPTFSITGIKKFPIKNIDPKTFERIYERHIDDHEEILEDIKYGIEHDMIKVKIQDFFASHAYYGIRGYREKHEELIIRKYDEF